MSIFPIFINKNIIGPNVTSNQNQTEYYDFNDLSCINSPNIDVGYNFDTDIEKPSESSSIQYINNHIEPSYLPLIIIGDLHGNLRLAERIVSFYEASHNFLFLGDLLDSFEFSIDNQVNLVQFVINLCKSNKAKLILGNHELSYINTELFKCSGFNQLTKYKLIDSNLIHSLQVFGKNILDVQLIIKNSYNYFVFTHAGISNEFYKFILANSSMDTNLVTDHGYFNVVLTSLSLNPNLPESFNIGLERGGMDSFPGIYWCDYYKEFELPKLNIGRKHINLVHLTQFFGHTYVRQNKLPKATNPNELNNSSSFEIECDYIKAVNKSGNINRAFNLDLFQSNHSHNLIELNKNGEIKLIKFKEKE